MSSWACAALPAVSTIALIDCNTAVPAAQGFRREWRMRAENRSPAWTTRIEDVPVVTI
ncbi:DUF4113 domain-containing protein [Sphingomonas melonis]